jgi:predicted MPP superfamily phosphohydrolase
VILYGVFIERNKLVIREITVDNIPENIILIGDLHIRKDIKLYEKVGKFVRDSKAKIVLNIGDTFENILDYNFLSYLDNKRTYFVFGNNDYGSKESGKREEKIKKILQRHKIKVLQNSNVKLGKNFYLIGIDDPHKNRENIEEAFKDIPNNSIKFVMCHSPEVNDEILKYKPDYLFFGHTHGGQVRFPLIGSLFNNVRHGKVPKIGITKKNSTVLIHTTGIGTTLFPIRLLNPPEIILLKRGTLPQLSDF